MPEEGSSAPLPHFPATPQLNLVFCFIKWKWCHRAQVQVTDWQLHKHYSCWGWQCVLMGSNDVSWCRSWIFTAQTADSIEFNDAVGGLPTLLHFPFPIPSRTIHGNGRARFLRGGRRGGQSEPPSFSHGSRRTSTPRPLSRNYQYQTSQRRRDKTRRRL